MPELNMLLNTKSMILYFPPKATLGLARRKVSGLRRSPFPPAKTMAIVFFPTLSIEYIQPPRVVTSNGVTLLHSDALEHNKYTNIINM